MCSALVLQLLNLSVMPCFSYLTAYIIIAFFFINVEHVMPLSSYLCFGFHKVTVMVADIFECNKLLHV